MGEGDCISGFTSSGRLSSGCSSLLKSLGGECVRLFVDDAGELWREWEADDADRDSRRWDDFSCGRTMTKRRDVGRSR